MHFDWGDQQPMLISIIFQNPYVQKRLLWVLYKSAKVTETNYI